jgi:hypothetical protein
MLHLPGHRQRKYQRKKDALVREALQRVGGRASVKTTPTQPASGRKRRPRRTVSTRYALVQIRGAVIEVLGFASGKNRKAVERAFGILDRDDLAAVAGRHLPEVV